MSMQFSIYIGPLLKCTGKADAYELTDGRLCELRGELRSDDGNVRYVGPNINMPHITRQLRFDRHSETPVISGINRSDEVASFIHQFPSDIQLLRQAFDDVSVE